MSFTVDGSPALEARVAQDLTAIKEAILSIAEEGSLAGIVLGGGYGRGEGAVFVEDGEERVYNDYDFFVIVPDIPPSRRRALAHALTEVKSIMEPRCGIHVDFSSAIRARSLSRLPYELMYMELKEGHHVVIGPDDILSSMPDYDPMCPPLEECTRLFMNRGVGLILARQKMDSAVTLGEEDYQFIIRNIRKAQLAMGDAVMFARACYSPSYVERLKTFVSLPLDDLPVGERLFQYYQEAVKFKLRPEHQVPNSHSLGSWHDEVSQVYCSVFLWFERYRLNEPDMDWGGYQRRKRRLDSGGLMESLKNVYRNSRVKTRSLPMFRDLVLHPRDRVLAYLPSFISNDVQDEKITMDLLKLWERYA